MGGGVGSGDPPPEAEEILKQNGASTEGCL